MQRRDRITIQKVISEISAVPMESCCRNERYNRSQVSDIKDGRRLYYSLR